VPPLTPKRTSRQHPSRLPQLFRRPRCSARIRCPRPLRPARDGEPRPGRREAGRPAFPAPAAFGDAKASVVAYLEALTWRAGRNAVLRVFGIVPPSQVGCALESRRAPRGCAARGSPRTRLPRLSDRDGHQPCRLSRMARNAGAGPALSDGCRRESSLARPSSAVPRRRCPRPWGTPRGAGRRRCAGPLPSPR